MHHTLTFRNCSLPTQCIWLTRMSLTTWSNHFANQPWPVGFYKGGGVCFPSDRKLFSLHKTSKKSKSAVLKSHVIETSNWRKWHVCHVTTWPRSLPWLHTAAPRTMDSLQSESFNKWCCHSRPRCCVVGAGQKFTEMSAAPTKCILARLGELDPFLASRVTKYTRMAKR